MPVEPRDAARLLVDRGSAQAAHRAVRDLPEILRPGDLRVVTSDKELADRVRASGSQVIGVGEFRRQLER